MAKRKMQTVKKKLNLAGPKPFEMHAKKPEPDDRPRPINKGKSARERKLKGVML